MIATTALRRIHYLMVDDDEDHTDIVRIVFGNCHHHNELTTVPNGREALRYLRRQREDSAKAPVVDVVLLDISMPGMSGIEVLREIRADTRLKTLPVVMFTSSDSPRDIEAAYAASANSYVVKPIDFNAFRQVIEQIDTFWSGCNRPPTHTSS